MILFDWNKLYTTTKGNPVDIVRVLRMLTEKRLPLNKYDKLYQYATVDFRGESFLIHPERLLYNSHLDTHRDIAIYVAFAALRPLSDYFISREVRLNPLNAPEELLRHIESNRLLSIDEEGMINFLYEGSPTPQEIH